MTLTLFLYALGGGYGHIQRTLGLAKAFKRQQHSLRVLPVLPVRAKNFAEKQNVQCLFVNDCNPSTIRTQLDSWWSQYEPTAIVVDCFPLGLHQELKGYLEGVTHRYFLSRWMSPQLFVGENAKALSLFSQHYVWEKSPSWQLLPERTEVSPVLSLRTKDYFTKEEARKTLNLPQKGKVVLSLFSGQTAQTSRRIKKLKKHCEKESILFCSFEPQSRLGRHFSPLAPHFSAADLIISAGGSAVYEIAQSGVPAMFFPQKRPYDRQDLRPQGAFGHTRSNHRTVENEQNDFTLLQECLQLKTLPMMNIDASDTVARDIINNLKT